MVRNINIEHTLAALPYLFYIPIPVLVPLIFAIIFRKNKFILFHSVQALFIHIIIGAFISLTLSFFMNYCNNLAILSVKYEYGDFYGILTIIIGLLYLLVIITPILLGVYYSSGGKCFKFPIIGNISEKVCNYIT
ncbi:hypothetical protein [Methanothermococcus okinawensis]|uniref:hypothetical protein n=1 Tax=Methanothermococcus okinawensis TaxID=155863 RepID=UPI00068F6102|nr:hypothetical protein [Methanothermococcus okinawensis]